jgi:RecB family endonuclease NucS
MIPLVEAQKIAEEALRKEEMLILIGQCYVEYWGRAASKLQQGSRMLLIKGDGSFAIHQNKYLRPVNYMMNSTITCGIKDGNLVLMASKVKPQENIKVIFSEVGFAQSFGMEDGHDVRLFGSEEELSKLLAQDLNFIEEGLKPLKQEHVYKKGVADIIAEDANNNLVIVEVKRRKAGLDSVSQLHRYREQGKKQKNRKMRGSLLAPEITNNALDMAHDYGLEFYKLDFEIGNPSAKIKGLEKTQTKLF